MNKSAPKQLKFEKKSWGGRRAGAGRKKILLSEPSHIKREIVTQKTPVHVTLKIHKGLPSLRQTNIFLLIAKAIAKARSHGLRVIHFSVQSNHLHMLVEANSHHEFVRGMQSLTIRLAKAIKKSLGSAGDKIAKVFLGRFHSRVLKSPAEVKRALRYVLQNTAKHLGRGKREPLVLDQCSSVHMLENPRTLFGSRAETKYAREFFKRGPPPLHQRVAKSVGEFLSKPRSWVLVRGWKLARA